MTTDNSRLQSITAINRTNADIKAESSRIGVLATRINGKCSSTGLESGTKDSTIDDEYDKIAAAVIAIDAQVDVLFPVDQAEPNHMFIVSGTVEDAAPTKIIIQLSEEGVITDETGFSISGCTSAASFSAAAILTDKTTLELTTNAAVDDDDVPVVVYNGATGNLISYANAGDTCDSHTGVTITNNVEA